MTSDEHNIAIENSKSTYASQHHTRRNDLNAKILKKNKLTIRKS